MDSIKSLRIAPTGEERRVSKPEFNTCFDYSLGGFLQALKAYDEDTWAHSLRVAELSVRLARLMGLPGDLLAEIEVGALLHDIGKLRVPRTVLHKRPPLTRGEYSLLQSHPLSGYEMLSQAHWMQGALDVPLSHHERWDGSGYPYGLCEEQIPLAARIVAAADVWDALVSDRPYRPALQEHIAYDRISALAGRHFDPAVVEILQQSFAEVVC